MTELEKLDAGIEFCVLDPEVDARKKRAVLGCVKLAAVAPLDHTGQLAVLWDLFGSMGKDANVLPGFHCDNGKNIHVGEDFLANYNVTILDIAPVYIGDYCMIGLIYWLRLLGIPYRPKVGGKTSLWESRYYWWRRVDWR